jgi:LPXTG-motif cell wall-anchored protein
MMKRLLLAVSVVVALMMSAAPAYADGYPPTEGQPPAQEEPVAPPETPKPPLPVTGSDSSLPLARGAVVILAGGGILLLAARRRRANLA